MKRVIGVPRDVVEIKGYEIWVNRIKLMHEVILNYRTELLDNPYGCDGISTIHNPNQITPTHIIQTIFI